MNLFYNTSIAAGATVYSSQIYQGESNVSMPTVGQPAICIFTQGASDGLTVVLQAAATPNGARQPPLNTDWVDVLTLTSDEITNNLSLNGLWLRFAVTNSGATAAPITISLGR